MDKVEDVMLDLAWRRISDLWQDKQELENKAGILLASNGVLLGFVANAWNMLNHWLALAGIVCMWFSAISCVLALRTRKYKEFDILESWEEFKEYFEDVYLLKRGLYSTLGSMEKINRDLVADIAKWYSKGVWLFLGSMSFIMLSLLASFFV